jgi:hypothetical protein
MLIRGLLYRVASDRCAKLDVTVCYVFGAVRGLLLSAKHLFFSAKAHGIDPARIAREICDACIGAAIPRLRHACAHATAASSPPILFRFPLHRRRGRCSPRPRASHDGRDEQMFGAK